MRKPSKLLKIIIIAILLTPITSIGGVFFDSNYTECMEKRAKKTSGPERKTAHHYCSQEHPIKLKRNQRFVCRSRFSTSSAEDIDWLFKVEKQSIVTEGAGQDREFGILSSNDYVFVAHRKAGQEGDALFIEQRIEVRPKEGSGALISYISINGNGTVRKDQLICHSL